MREHCQCSGSCLNQLVILWAKVLGHFMQVVMFKQLKISECVELEVGWTSLLRHVGFTISQQS